MIYTKGDAIQSLKPNAQWVLRDGVLEWLDENQTKPTDSAIESEITRLNKAESMRLLRIERDNRLAKTDWRASSDLTLSDDWRTYRQSLRDLPASASPKLDSDGNLDMLSVTFPTEPS